MTTNKRFTIKPQDDLFGVVDNYSLDKICVVNGIRTEIETKWLCNVMNDLNDENEQLKAQLYCDSEEGVCSICKHHYLDNGSIYYISQCEKGHEECSTDALKHCNDFELNELIE